MTCPYCNDYRTQMHNAAANNRPEQFEALKKLYLAHLADKHSAFAQTVKVDRARVREALGKMGDL